MESDKNPSGRLVKLTNRSVFEVTGADRVRYLNGQVTNDVSKITETESMAACVCNLKGRVEFLIWIRSDGESLWIDGQLDQREELFARLDRYLIADDCEILDRTEEGLLFHHFCEEIPGSVSNRSPFPGKDLWISRGEPVPFPEGEEIDLAEFRLWQLQQRIPSAPEEITGSEFPAELGIESWTVDFHKGCYLGQEVISRIESVGKVKRQLCLVVAKVPFDQNSVLRNTLQEEFRPTGAGREISMNCYLGFAWVKGDVNISQPVYVE